MELLSYSFQATDIVNFIHKNLKELKHLYHSTHVSIEFQTLEFKQEDFNQSKKSHV